MRRLCLTFRLDLSAFPRSVSCEWECFQLSWGCHPVWKFVRCSCCRGAWGKAICVWKKLIVWLKMGQQKRDRLSGQQSWSSHNRHFCHDAEVWHVIDLHSYGCDNHGANLLPIPEPTWVLVNPPRYLHCEDRDDLHDNDDDDDDYDNDYNNDYDNDKDDDKDKRSSHAIILHNNTLTGGNQSCIVNCLHSWHCWLESAPRLNQAMQGLISHNDRENTS